MVGETHPSEDSLVTEARPPGAFRVAPIIVWFFVEVIEIGFVSTRKFEIVQTGLPCLLFFDRFRRFERR